ncbi:MAG: hypothetical protein ABI566_05140 [Pseudolysinimonas sp.]
MSATGEITIIHGGGWAESLGFALVRWGRRRSVRARRIAEQRALVGRERRAELEEHLLLEHELQTWKRELDRSNALQRLYRGV